MNKTLVVFMLGLILGLALGYACFASKKQESKNLNDLLIGKYRVENWQPDPKETNGNRVTFHANKLAITIGDDSWSPAKEIEFVELSCLNGSKTIHFEKLRNGILRLYDEPSHSLFPI